VCSRCTTSPYREVCRVKGGIGSGEILCHDIYPARPITTVSLATNTYCAPRTVGPRVQFSGACEQSHWWPARHTEGSHLLSVVKAVTNTERPNSVQIWFTKSNRRINVPSIIFCQNNFVETCFYINYIKLNHDFFHTPLAFDAPVMGVSVGILPSRLVRKN